MNTQTIKCPHCAGKGRVAPETALPLALSRTLELIWKDGTQAHYIAARMVISVTSARNNLLALFKLGLVRREKVNGNYYYSRVIRERKAKH